MMFKTANRCNKLVDFANGCSAFDFFRQQKSWYLKNLEMTLTMSKSLLNDIFWFGRIMIFSFKSDFGEVGLFADDHILDHFGMTKDTIIFKSFMRRRQGTTHVPLDREKFSPNKQSWFQLGNKWVHFPVLLQFIAFTIHSWLPGRSFSEMRLKDDSSPSPWSHLVSAVQSHLNVMECRVLEVSTTQQSRKMF